MHQHIQIRADVQMAQLQRTRQRDYHGRIHLTQTALSVCVVRRSSFELLHKQRWRYRFRRDATCQRRIVVDVELEEVEEGVVYEVYRAVDILLDAEEEFEGSSCLVTYWEGDVGELA